jgi:hypothetical protein
VKKVTWKTSFAEVAVIVPVGTVEPVHGSLRAARTTRRSGAVVREGSPDQLFGFGFLPTSNAFRRARSEFTG